MSDYNKRPLILGVLTIFIVSMVGVLSAVLFIKLSGINTTADVQLLKQTLIFGFIMYIFIVSGLIGAIEYLRIHNDKQQSLLEKNAETILGKSELMRFLHNELKRNDGNELQLLADDKSLLMIFQEISDLQKIAKLQDKRKKRTAPGSDTQDDLVIKIDHFIAEQGKKVDKLPLDKTKI